MCGREVSETKTVQIVQVYPGSAEWLHWFTKRCDLVHYDTSTLFPVTGAYLDPGEPSSILHSIRSALSRILGAIKSFLDPSQFD